MQLALLPCLLWVERIKFNRSFLCSVSCYLTVANTKMQVTRNSITQNFAVLIVMPLEARTVPRRNHAPKFNIAISIID